MPGLPHVPPELSRAGSEHPCPIAAQQPEQKATIEAPRRPGFGLRAQLPPSLSGDLVATSGCALPIEHVATRGESPNARWDEVDEPGRIVTCPEFHGSR